jgi:hypothetical protein
MARYYRLDEVDPILRGQAEKHISQHYKKYNLNPNDYRVRITIYGDFQIAMLLIPKKNDKVYRHI